MTTGDLGERGEAGLPVEVPGGAAAEPFAGPSEHDPAGVEMLAAALRADRTDLATYERVLFASLADSLPAGAVDVQRERSMADRVAGRPGKPSAIRVHLGDETLEIAERRGTLTASVARDVRGVTISRRDVTLSEWSLRLAELLEKVASESAATRQALARLLGTT